MKLRADHHEVDQGRASAVSHEGYLRRVASETGDVVVDPDERGQLVSEPVVGHVRPRGGAALIVSRGRYP